MYGYYNYGDTKRNKSYSKKATNMAPKTNRNFLWFGNTHI